MTANCHSPFQAKTAGVHYLSKIVLGGGYKPAKNVRFENFAPRENDTKRDISSRRRTRDNVNTETGLKSELRLTSTEEFIANSAP